MPICSCWTTAGSAPTIPVTTTPPAWVTGTQTLASCRRGWRRWPTRRSSGASGSGSGWSPRWSTRSATSTPSTPTGWCVTAGHHWSTATNSSLDPLRGAVRDFEVDVVDRTLAQHDQISYVKWDANRPITDPGSVTLGRDRQSNLWVDHVRATWEVMARGRAASSRRRADAVRLGRRSHRPRHPALVPRVLDLGQHRSGHPGPHAVGVLALLPARRHGRARHPVGGSPARRSPARWRCRDGSASTWTSRRSRPTEEAGAPAGDRPGTSDPGPGAARGCWSGWCRRSRATTAHGRRWPTAPPTGPGRWCSPTSWRNRHRRHRR